MRDRFESEMRRVEDEMQRLRREFEGGDLMSTRPVYDPYLDNLKSPLIKDESDGKTLRLRFDVAQYKPEEVTVKTVDNRLLVHAKHEEKTPSRTVYREYNQEFMLPRGTNPESISSTLSTDGVLTVEAPLPQLAIQQ
uniref:SHSP domain-containing protein n=1 Tax=Panagrellus redivivus TaxID=6233 RepID=A0A7E4VF90_PANRE